jgi:hypothetical protein
MLITSFEAFSEIKKSPLVTNLNIENIFEDEEVHWIKN